MWLLAQAALPSVMLWAHMMHLAQEAPLMVLMSGCMWLLVQAALLLAML
jgi:hypothetical protein